MVSGKRNIKRIISYLAIGSQLIFIESGCYTTSQGSYLNTVTVPGSKDIVRYEQKIIEKKQPNIGEPQLILQISQKPVFQETQYDVYHEKRVMTGTGRLVYISAYLITLGGAAIGLSDSLSTEDKSNGWIWAGAGGLLVYFMPKFTGNTGRVINSEYKQVTQEGDWVKPYRYTVSVNERGKTIRYRTDNQGQIHIKLIEDFDLSLFKEPRVINLNISGYNPQFSKNITLYTQDWTFPYFRITAKKGWGFSQPSGAAWKKFTYNQSEIYRIWPESGPEWIKIESIRDNQKVGWVPAQVGEKFWAYPGIDFSKLK